MTEENPTPVYRGSLNWDLILDEVVEDVSELVMARLQPGVASLRERLSGVASDQIQDALKPIAAQLAANPDLRAQVANLGLASESTTAHPLTVTQDGPAKETTTVHPGEVVQSPAGDDAGQASTSARGLSMPGPIVTWSALVLGLQTAVADALEGESEEYIRTVVLTLVGLLLLLLAEEAGKRD